MQVNRDLEKQFVNETKTQWGTPTDDYYNKYIKWLEDKAIQVQARVSLKVADIDKGLGKCMEKNCNRFATTDYNGHKHYVCKYHYEKLTREFEEDYD